MEVNYSFSMEGHKIHILMLTHGTITKAIPSHSHSKNSYEVHYIFGGKGTLTVQGNAYSISPGILFVTGPGIEHAQNPEAGNTIQEDCLYFYIEGEGTPDKNSPVIHALRSCPFWFGQDTQNIADTIRMIQEELPLHQIGHAISMNACFQRYLVQLTRNMVSVPTQELTDAGPVQLLIENAFLNRYKDLTLDDICHIAGMSRRQTQRLLIQYYGYGFQKKRTASRMAAAAAFLLHSDLSPEEIAELVGYSGLSSFLQAFKGYYHMTTKEYRKSGGF